MVVAWALILIFAVIVGYSMLSKPKVESPWPLPEPPPIYPAAQEREGLFEIWVGVHDEMTLQPVASAKVTLGKRMPVATAMTNEEGRAIFNMETGNYNCVIIKEGYEMFQGISPVEGNAAEYGMEHESFNVRIKPIMLIGGSIL